MASSDASPRPNARRGLRLALVLAALLPAGPALLPGCANRPRHEVLSMFFDGVPDPSQPAPAKPAASRGQIPGARASKPAPTPVQWVVHEPFGDRSCSKCHQNDFSQELKKPVPRLCYGCHDNWTKEYDVVHEPVKKGECAKCHLPHKSKLDHLLADNLTRLCDSCHKPEATLPVVHEPFAKGDCLACHDPHGADNEPLLVESGNALCAKCHEPAHFARAPGHLGQEQKDCSSCHDAHQSLAKHLVKPAE